VRAAFPWKGVLRIDGKAVVRDAATQQGSGCSQGSRPRPRERPEHLVYSIEDLKVVGEKLKVHPKDDGSI